MDLSLLKFLIVGVILLFAGLLTANLPSGTDSAGAGVSPMVQSGSSIVHEDLGIATLDLVDNDGA